MCEFCNTTLSGKFTQFGKAMNLKNTASPTDMKDCQIIIHENEPSALVIFDRFGRGAFIEISNCPICGRKLGKMDNDMEKRNHKLGIKLPDTSKNCCQGIQIYIDKERINAISLYPLDRDRQRIEDLGKTDLEFDVMELEVCDIEDIAVLMNEKTFDRFCELWRKYHNSDKYKENCKCNS